MTRRELLMAFAALPVVTAMASAALAQQAGDAFGQYGRRFLTLQEREQFHLEMQNAETQEERARIRERHRDIIRERAREQGVTLPENFGDGMQQRGQGSGSGMGGQGKSKGN